MTTQRVDDVVPSNGTPIRWRVALRPPSQPTRSAPAPLAAPSVQHRGDTVGVLGAYSVIWVPQRTCTCVESVQPAKQFGVDQGLHEAVALGPAEPRVGRRHLDEQPPVGVEEPQDLVGHGVRQDGVDQSDRLERAQRFVVESDTARIVDQGVALLDDQGLNTLQTKHIGQGQADRSGTDDQDVGMRLVPASSRSLSAPTGSRGAGG